MVSRLGWSIVVVAAWSIGLGAQPAPQAPLGPEGYRPGVEVERYHFELVLSDESDRIEATARLDVRFRTDTSTVLILDLWAPDRARGTGMAVAEVRHEEVVAPHRQWGDTLSIGLVETPRADDLHRFTVTYAGRPADGLIIGENRHGRRTFFGDNWPNRARHWLPTIDHPSAKALVEWTVTLPRHYGVVANGRLRESSDLGDGTRRVHWSTTAPIPIKVAVIGAAEFAVDYPAVVEGIPIESWVYPEDRAAGFSDFARAERVMEVFTSLLGEYPFAKLANVQSTTRYGGMENASAIFYDEHSVTGTGENEWLIAHEVAHQWFGNAVTEADWPHLWLSEGFATYLTNVYVERIYGDGARAERMAADRRRVAAFAAQQPHRAVIDSTYADPTELLNPNSYHKAGWVLHLLRRKVGDDAFFQGLRRFYDRFSGGNADTDDFRATMEAVSGQGLEAFFRRWLERPGIPVVAASWRAAAGGLILTVEQLQPADPFTFPLEVAIVSGGEEVLTTVEVQERRQQFTLPEPSAADFEVVIDPHVHTLMDLRRAGPR